MVQPLSLLPVGSRSVIKEIRSRHEIKHHLESLGFVSGAEVCVVCEAAGNIIVGVRESRIAVSRAMAHDIVVDTDPSIVDRCASCPSSHSHAAAQVAAERGEA